MVALIFLQAFAHSFALSCAQFLDFELYPLRAKRVREVANLTERKNLHTPVSGVKEFVCLSICPSVTNFDPNYLRTG